MFEKDSIVDEFTTSVGGEFHLTEEMPFEDIIFEAIEFGYNKAKEEGRWHDLRENPNDLPKANQKVLLQIKDEDEPIKDFYRRDGIWNFANKYEVIAWCEIPKYIEE